MDKEFLCKLLIHISAFGVSDNVLNYFKVSTEKRIIFYLILFFFTCTFLRSPSNPVNQDPTEK